MRTIIAAIAALSLGAFAPTASAAQAAPEADPAASAPASDEIIVFGDKERRKLINAYIKATIEEEPAGQYAKFGSALCPSVVGFNEELTSFIEARMRTVAQAAEVAVTQGDCKANVQVLVVKDGPAMINRLRQRNKGAFGKMRPHERRKLTAAQGPAYVWHLVDTIGTTSKAKRDEPGSGLVIDTGTDGGAYSLLSSDLFKTARSNNKSLITEPVSQSINHAFVLIEKDAVMGLDPRQIADFATVMALARAESESAEAPPIETIRTLFQSAPEEAPLSLTAWDLALLTSLYKARGNMRAGQQRASMASTFERVLDEQKDES